MGGWQLSIVLLAITGKIVAGDDYYWRDFEGIVPDDAYVAATNADNAKVYIGNVYIHGVGVIVGELYDGTDSITVTGGVEKLGELFTRKENIQILCTEQPDNFRWIRANRTSLPQLRYNFVIGGQQSEYEGHLYVGRIDYEGSRIGKLDAYYTQIIDLYFPYKGAEKSTIDLPNSDFEVLIYDDGTNRVDLSSFRARLEPPAIKLAKSHN